VGSGDAGGASATAVELPAMEKMLGLYGGTSSVWRTDRTSRDCFRWGGGSSGWTSMASGIWGGMLQLSPFFVVFLKRGIRGGVG
jgi:hypothetical protein